MAQIDLDPTEFEKAALEFNNAAKQLHEIGARLDERMDTLSKTWQQSSEHDFMELYKTWRLQITDFSGTLGQIAARLDEITQNLYAADN